MGNEPHLVTKGLKMKSKHFSVGMLVLGLLAATSLAAEPEKKDIASTSPDAKTEHFLKARQSLAEDPYRPLYHFSPPGFGLHDPGGLCWWQGKYHLFYLFTFNGIKWARGHAVSDDLLHWRDLPMLPIQIKGGTGQAWAEKDRVILGYSSSKLATASDPLLLNWVQHPQEPRIEHGGDNFLWRAGDWYFLTQRKHSADPSFVKGWPGRKHSGDGPGWFYSGKTTLEILRSKDLTQWEPLGLFLEDDCFTDPGEDCACPNVLPLGGGKHLVLFFSHKRGPQYYIGKLDQKQGRFTIENHGRMNYGPPMRASLHAPSGFVDPNGRCIGMWNIFECLGEQIFGGLKDGVMSLPRRMSLKGPKKSTQMNPLCIEPIEELKALRFNPVKMENVAIPANGEKILTGVRGRAMELEAVIDPGKAREVGLRILRSPNGEEQTTISLMMHAYAWPLNSGKRELMIDVSQASLSSKIASRSPEIGPLYLEDGEPLRVRVFIDRSIVEVFANGRQCLTLRAYPTRKDSTGVSVFARGSEANLVSLNAYQMKSAWPELKDQEGR